MFNKKYITKKKVELIFKKRKEIFIIIIIRFNLFKYVYDFIIKDIISLF